MPRSTKMFVEQSNLSMPSSVWLHINGVSLATDIHPYQPPPIHSYDYRTKHLQSPVPPPTPPLISQSTIVPCSIMIDGLYINNHNNYMNKQCQKLEHTDLPKKVFIARQIKKAKSLPGLIKGTALSRHIPLQSSTFASPALAISSASNIQDDQLPIVPANNDEDSLPIPQTETRRPRVYFADFNKIQFIEDNNTEISQTPAPYIHRRHRRRIKKPSNTNGTNHISPSIQQTQIFQNYSRPLSRQQNHQIARELSIRKQRLIGSPRAQSSRIMQLPDIQNPSLPIELSSNDNSNGKYTLLREKPLIRLPRPVIEIPSALAPDNSSEDIQNGIGRSSPIQDSHIQIHEYESGESSTATFLQSSPSISTTSINRPRPLLRTISLRQQFITPNKLKPTGPTSTTNNNNNYYYHSNNSLLNTRRPGSLKPSTLQMHDDNDDLHPINPSLLISERRPMTGTKFIKQSKRSDIIHFNSKIPVGGNPTNDSNKSHIHDPTQERFQNLLTVVRAPYVTGNGTSSNVSSIIPNDSTMHPNQSIAHIRSSRSKSARGPFGFHITQSSILV